jgi:hypothetical protein
LPSWNRKMICLGFRCTWTLNRKLLFKKSKKTSVRIWIRARFPKKRTVSVLYLRLVPRAMRQLLLQLRTACSLNKLLQAFVTLQERPESGEMASCYRTRSSRGFSSGTSSIQLASGPALRHTQFPKQRVLGALSPVVK